MVRAMLDRLRERARAGLAGRGRRHRLEPRPVSPKRRCRSVGWLGQALPSRRPLPAAGAAGGPCPPARRQESPPPRQNRLSQSRGRAYAAGVCVLRGAPAFEDFRQGLRRAEGAAERRACARTPSPRPWPSPTEPSTVLGVVLCGVAAVTAARGGGSARRLRGRLSRSWMAVGSASPG
nr:serine/arginine repetitive matrix protein 3-like [Microcebus murinus]